MKMVADIRNGFSSTHASTEKHGAACKDKLGGRREGECRLSCGKAKDVSSTGHVSRESICSYRTGPPATTALR
jgi:hypothetical protein